MKDDSPATIARFLRRHPDFLAENPELYRALTPPLRVHGENLTDHMDAMVRRARAHALDMQSCAEEVLASGRAAAAMQARVQEAIVAAIAAADLAEFVPNELPALLGLDAASLCAEAPRPRWRALPPGAVQRLLGGRPVAMRDRPEDAALLHAEAARLAARDVLIRLPGATPTLLALASRDPGTPGAAATPALAFLGRALGALLAR